MDMQTFGRELADVLAQRSLEVLRNTSMSDVRDVVTGRFLRPEGNGHVSLATAIGAMVAGAAIGAGLTALLTPTTGPELQKRIARSTRGARKQAMAIGESIATEVGHAGQSLVDRVESATTAIGLVSPAPAKRRTSRTTDHHAMNGHAKRSTKHAHA